MAKKQALEDRPRILAELNELTRDLPRASRRCLRRLAAGAAATLLIGLNASPLLMPSATAAGNCDTATSCSQAILALLDDASQASSAAVDLAGLAHKLELAAQGLDGPLTSAALKLPAAQGALSDAHKLNDAALTLDAGALKLGQDASALKLDASALKLIADSPLPTAGYKAIPADQLATLQQSTLKLDSSEGALKLEAAALQQEYQQLVAELGSLKLTIGLSL